jgi:5-hydroxyisourate hydrolase
MGVLTTHALNTMSGNPAVNLRIDLSMRVGDDWRLLKTARTNAQGRTDTPLLAQAEVQNAEYELLFHVAEYFAALGVPQSSPPFLDKVPIRFGIGDTAAHYHVPLLVTPWSYSTYRGS